MLVEMCIYDKEMSWCRNTITDLYNAVLAPVAAIRDALASRLESVRETATLLYERAKQKLGYGQRLKDIVEEQTNQDYIGIEDIKLIASNEDIKLIAAIRVVDHSPQHGLWSTTRMSAKEEMY